MSMNNAIISSKRLTHKEIPSLYILKALCAFAVILIHTGLIYKGILAPLYRLAVPLFFMISGYFMVSENGNISVERPWKSLKKIFWINLTATCVYLFYRLLLSIFHYFITGTTDFYSIFLPKHFWENLLLSHPYVYSLWYLVAYMQVLLVVIFFVYIKRFSLLLKIFPIFFIIGLLMGSYNLWMPFEELCYHRNFLTMGLPFVLLGSWIKVNQKKCLSFFDKTPLLILIFSIFAAYLEYTVLKLILHTRGDYYLTTILLSLAVFLYFIRSPYIGKDRKITKKLIIIGRDFSLFLYLYHLLVANIIGLIAHKLGFSVANYEYLIVLPLTLLAGITVKSFSNLLHKNA